MNLLDKTGLQNFYTSLKNIFSLKGHGHEKNDIIDFSHNHGNITNDGKVGTASDKLLVTGADGTVTTATSLTATSVSSTTNPSVTLSNGTLNFNIPKGADGSPGASAGFGTPTATISNTTGTPSVTVSASGANTAKVFNFAFSGLKGETGPAGTTAWAGITGKPSTFAPSSHTHTVSEISDFNSVIGDINTILDNINGVTV